MLISIREERRLTVNSARRPRTNVHAESGTAYFTAKVPTLVTMAISLRSYSQSGTTDQLTVRDTRCRGRLRLTCHVLSSTTSAENLNLDHQNFHLDVRSN